MRAIIAAACLMAAAVTGASAADLPGPAITPPPTYVPEVHPVYNWTGFYIGVNGGYGLGNNDVSVSYLGTSLSLGNASWDGAVAGGTVGFNYQINNFVVGIEGDFDWSGFQKSGSDGFVSATTKINWLSTVRGRVGYAVDRLLLYATAGAVIMDNEFDASIPGASLSASSVNAGWTAGAGGEAMLIGNLTAKVEYLFVYTDASINLVSGVSQNSGIRNSIVRAGLNYRF